MGYDNATGHIPLCQMLKLKTFYLPIFKYNIFGEICANAAVLPTDCFKTHNTQIRWYLALKYFTTKSILI